MPADWRLYDHDWFMVAADFDSYAARSARWTSAGPIPPAVGGGGAQHRPYGWFSSDRTIREYAKDIWGIL